jgi:hypothetical protein
MKGIDRVPQHGVEPRDDASPRRRLTLLNQDRRALPDVLGVGAVTVIPPERGNRNLPRDAHDIACQA